MDRSVPRSTFAHCGLNEESAVSATTNTDLQVQARAREVIATTARAWNVSRESPRALARRAPHGYVPVRVLRRLRGSLPDAPRAFCW